MGEPSDRREGWLPSAEHWAGGLLEGEAKLVKDAGKVMLREAPRGARIVAQRIPGLPGLVYDAATLSRAGDKKRALAGIVGGGAGAMLGGLGGPVGAAVGSAVGERAAELAYDHRDDIKAWMDDRWTDIAARARQESRPYVPPYLRR